MNDRLASPCPARHKLRCSHRGLAWLLAVLLIPSAGCETDEGFLQSQLAEQTNQNRVLAEEHRELAASGRSLADVVRELQQHSQSLGSQQAEWLRTASRESRLAPILHTLGQIALAILPLVLAWRITSWLLDAR